jgi:hypothetical protein
LHNPSKIQNSNHTQPIKIQNLQSHTQPVKIQNHIFPITQTQPIKLNCKNHNKETRFRILTEEGNQRSNWFQQKIQNPKMDQIDEFEESEAINDYQIQRISKTCKSH